MADNHCPCGSAITDTARQCRSCNAKEQRRKPRARTACLTQPEIDRLRRLTDQYGIATAASISGTCAKTIMGARERGWAVGNKSRVRPMPSDFAIQASDMTVRQLCEHYSASYYTIRKWADAVGRENHVARPGKLDVPADLAGVIARLGLKGAAAHYGCNKTTLLRLRREAGLCTPTPDRGIGWVDTYIAR